MRRPMHSEEKHNLYYQAIIQIRPESDEIIDFVQKALAEDKKVFVSMVKKVKTGVDLYVSSNQFALGLVRKFKKRFKGGIVKTSRLLYSRNRETSKDVYRVTVLLKKEQEAI